MVFFGLYIGQRLADVATLRWSNVDLVKGEIRLRTRKTDKMMILPIAAPLRRYLEGLPSSDDVNKPLHVVLLRLLRGKGNQALYRVTLLSC
jgi:integrase